MNKDIERTRVDPRDGYLLRLLCDVTATKGVEKGDSAVQVNACVHRSWL